MPQNSSGCLVMTCGPGTMPWMVMAPTISAITGVGRDAEREQRDERGLRRRRCWRSPAPRRPRWRRCRSVDGFFDDLLLERVGGERRDAPRRRPAGCRAASRATVPRTIGAGELPSGPRGSASGRSTLALHDRRGFSGCSRLRMISREAEHAHARRRRSRCRRTSSGDAEGHALGAGLEVGADHRQQQAEQDHGDRLEHRALAPARPRRSGRAPSARSIRPDRTAARGWSAARRARRPARSRRSRRRTSRWRRWRARRRRGPAAPSGGRRAR